MSPEAPFGYTDASVLSCVIDGDGDRATVFGSIVQCIEQQHPLALERLHEADDVAKAAAMWKHGADFFGVVARWHLMYFSPEEVRGWLEQAIVEVSE